MSSIMDRSCESHAFIFNWFFFLRFITHAVPHFQNPRYTLHIETDAVLA